MYSFLFQSRQLVEQECFNLKSAGGIGSPTFVTATGDIQDVSLDMKLFKLPALWAGVNCTSSIFGTLTCRMMSMGYLDTAHAAGSLDFNFGNFFFGDVLVVHKSTGDGVLSFVALSIGFCETFQDMTGGKVLS